MILSSAPRKVLLTVHVSSSVGWLGAVAAFLVLAIAGLTGDGAADSGLRVRGCYVAMDLVARFIIVPLTFASLLSGIVQALATRWGLFRHWWVVIKLLITVLSTLILLLHMQPIREMARVAIDTPLLASGDARELRLQLVVDVGAALVALLVATTLSVVKPAGLTARGRRKARDEQASTRP